MNNSGYFDNQVAARYDESLAEMFATDVVIPTVDFLAALAGKGRALEFGIGTGRIAIPLSQRGVSVHGIDLSEAMVSHLYEKPGSKGIDVTIGDFSTLSVGGSFSIVYLIFNTIMNLTTQEAQVACFHNAAAHLVPGGCFIIEVMLPDLQRLPHGEIIRPFKISDIQLGFDEYNIAEQGLISHHFEMINGRWERQSIPFRYVWPAELDLMAQLAGMRLRERWAGWRREPFTSDSQHLVAVWEIHTEQ